MDDDKTVVNGEDAEDVSSVKSDADVVDDGPDDLNEISDAAFDHGDADPDVAGTGDAETEGVQPASELDDVFQNDVPVIPAAAEALPEQASEKRIDKIKDINACIDRLEANIKLLEISVENFSKATAVLQESVKDIPANTAALNAALTDAHGVPNSLRAELAEVIDSQSKAFRQLCQDHYIKLVDQAVKNFKQFSHQATAWQTALEKTSNKQSKSLAKIIYLLPVLIFIVLVVLIFKR